VSLSGLTAIERLSVSLHIQNRLVRSRTPIHIFHTDDLPAS
jgi:hypothetical protein